MFCMLYIEKYLCIRRCRMNTFLELAKSRHSVRSYEKRAVEAEKLNRGPLKTSVFGGFP